jgi:hypothetical protein
MRQVGLPVVAFSLLLGSASNSQSHAQSAAPALSPLELRISGPRLIRRGETLKFKAVIVNRSPQPVAFAFRQGGWDCDGVFRWKITDTGDHLLPPVPREPIRGICCLTNGVSEDEIIVLQPGEKREATELGDPSDLYGFPRNGFYRVTLRLMFTPELVVYEANGQFHQMRREEVVEPKSKLELAVKTGPVDVTSNAWSLYLAD